MEPEAQVQLVIMMTADGRVGVQGPIDNKMLCYGLLEVAKEAIHDHHVEKARLVQPARLSMVPNRG
jgi:hypothetical protein